MTVISLSITSACRFTAPTAFANPPVTIVWALSDRFAGIWLVDVAMHIVANGLVRWGRWALTSDDGWDYARTSANLSLAENAAASLVCG